MKSLVVGLGLLASVASAQQRFEYIDRSALTHPGDDAVAAEGQRVIDAARLRGETPTVLSSNDLRQRLTHLRELVGAPPEPWQRYSVFALGQLESGYLVRLEAARDEAAVVRVLLAADAEAFSAAIRARATGVSTEQRVVLDAQLAQLQSRHQEATRRLEQLEAGIASSLSGPVSFAWELAVRGPLHRDVRTRALALEETLAEWGALAGPPVLGASLTYVNGESGAPGASAPERPVQPAYAAGASGTVPALEDTSVGREVVIEGDVRAKALELGTAAKAYDFVKNEFDIEWRHGAAQDTSTTLRARRGSQAELAGLLVALLRAQGTPARYVWGTIKQTPNQLAGAFGMLTSAEAASLSAGTLPYDGTRRAAVLRMLASAGVPHTATADSIALSHVWVEAYLGYGSYRGVGSGSEGKQWVPIEPTLLGAPKYILQPGIDALLSNMGETSASLVEAYLHEPRGGSFRAFVQQRVEAYLAARVPGRTFAQALSRRVRATESTTFIPGTLPYDVMGVEGEGVFLPESWLHTVDVVVREGSRQLLKYSTPAHRLSGHRVVLTFNPATDADKDVIAEFGGLYTSPASAVSLRPVFRVEGFEQSVGAGTIGLGATVRIELTLTSPGGLAKRVDNDVLAGNALALGVGAPLNPYVDVPGDVVGSVDGEGDRFRAVQAAAYANAWTEAEEEFAALLGTRVVRPTASVVFVENQLAVESAFGVRTRVAFKGLQVDADLRTATPLATNATAARDVMRLSGVQGSFLEAQVLASSVGEESVSAVTVIQEAYSQFVEVVTLDASNSATQLPTISAPPDAFLTIQDALARGLEVRVPRQQLTIRDWVGTGFLVRNPATEEGGYFLSGVVSGGQTAVSPNSWTDQELADRLRTNQPAAIDVANAVIGRIFVAPGRELQQTTVGAGPSTVGVYVTTIDGKPIKNVDVVFSPTGASRATFAIGAGATTCSGSPVTLTKKTDAHGLAEAKVCGEQHFTFFYKKPMPGGPPQNTGLTEVTAAVVLPGSAPPLSLTLARPMLLEVQPDRAHPHVIYPFDSLIDPGVYRRGHTNPGLSLFSSVDVKVVDSQDNPLAGEHILWTQGAAVGRFVSSDTAGAVFLDLNDASQLASTESTTANDGLTAVRYISPRVAGPVLIDAAVAGSTYSFASSSLEVLVDTEDLYTIRQENEVRASGPMGAYTTSPFLVKAYKRGETYQWAQVVAGVDGVTRVSGTLYKTQHREPSPQTTPPTPVLVAPMGAEDLPDLNPRIPGDDLSAVGYWPQISIRNGVEVNRLVVRVVSTVTREMTFDFQLRAAPIVVRPAIQKAGGSVVEVADVDPNHLGECQAPIRRRGWAITTPGVIPVFAKVSQTVTAPPAPPGAAGGTAAPPTSNVVLRFPDSVGAPPGHADLVPLAPVATTFLTGSREGTGSVSLSLVAYNPIFGTYDRLPADAWTTVVSSTISPCNPNAGAATFGQPADGEQSVSVVGSGTAVFVANAASPANITFPVRTFENQRLQFVADDGAGGSGGAGGAAGAGGAGGAGGAASLTDAERPFVSDGQLNFYVGKTGDVRVFVGNPPQENLVGQVHVVADATTVSDFGPIGLDETVSVPQYSADTNLFSIKLPPGSLNPQTVRITFKDTNTNSPATEVYSGVYRTTMKDLGVLPIGQTFVKGVSTADGHLVHQANDINLPGRGLPLSLDRTYSSNGTAEDRSPLGTGWAHSYRVTLKQSGTAGIRYRMVVSGGHGGGQVFLCNALTGPNSNCKPQPGYHGTLTPVEGDEWEYRTKGGIKYRFGVPGEADVRHLIRVTDSVGRVQHFLTEPRWRAEPVEVTEFIDPAVQPPWETDGSADTKVRSLRFHYIDAPTIGSAYPRTTLPFLLRRVELRIDGHAPEKPLCEDYCYDTKGNLAKAARTSCPSLPLTPPIGAACTLDRADTLADGTLTRMESYTYELLGPLDILGNMKSVTNANGNTTEFEYCTPATPMGGSDFFYYSGEAKKERICAVIEPGNLRTEFEYVLNEPLQFVTKVTPPRAGVPPTVYSLGLYGSVEKVVRPIDATHEAISQQHFDPTTHLLMSEVDANGRQTAYGYDGLGNLSSKTITTSALPPLEGVIDGATNTAVTSTTESWAYDAFSQWVLHVDATGRAESRETDVTTGLVKSHTKHWNRYTGGSAPAPASQDVSERFSYFPDVTIPTNAVIGDLTASFDGRNKRTTILAYDKHGNVTSSQSPVNVVTTSVFDERSRLESRSDTIGHRTETTYDDLDRTKVVKRFNAKPSNFPAVGSTTAASELQYTYWQGGQVHTEKQARTGLLKTFAYDELDRVISVTESGLQGLGPGNALQALPPQVTHTVYDENNNVICRVDRRGVATVTAYDFRDRPVKTAVGRCGTYGDVDSNGYEASTVGQPLPATGEFDSRTSPERLLSQTEYDPVGNVTASIDLSGNRTSLTLDALYRVVKTTLPFVPNAAGSGLVQWQPTRRYDLAGRVVLETDGNSVSSGLVTADGTTGLAVSRTTTYDGIGRVATMTDAVGRTETHEYDSAGNETRVTYKTGATVHRIVTTTLRDDINRPQTVQEQVFNTPTALNSASQFTYTTQTRYDDSTHEVAQRDARGFVSVTKYDDLDRAFETQRDVPSALGLDRTTSLVGPEAPGPAVSATTNSWFDANGNTTKTVDARGSETVTLVDGLGRVLQRTLPMGFTERVLKYDLEGHKTHWEDVRGVQWQQTYDVLGRPLANKVSDSTGFIELSRTDYDDTRTAPVLPDLPSSDVWATKQVRKDANGNATTVYLDALGRETKVVDAKQKAMVTTYDAKGKRLSIDRRGYRTQFASDAAYRPRTQTELSLVGATPVFVQTWTYDDAHRTVTQVDRTGISVKAEADGLGRVVKTTRTGAPGFVAAPVQFELHAFDEAGHEILSEDANNVRTARAFDGLGREVRTSAGSGLDVQTTTKKYDAVGNLLESKTLRDLHGPTYNIRNVYDALGRNVRSITALQLVTARAYDGAGNLLCVKEPKGFPAPILEAVTLSAAALNHDACDGSFVTSYSYDEVGKQLTTVDANNNVWKFAYDRQRNRIAQLDANGHLVRYTYDARNQRTAEFQILETSPQTLPNWLSADPVAVAPNSDFSLGTLVTRWTYDDSGNLETVRDPKDQVCTHVYGVLNRLESQTYSNDTSTALPKLKAIAYTYTKNGQPKTVDETKEFASGVAHEVTTHSYDGQERRISTLRYDGHVLTFGYDTKGNRTLVRDGANEATVYTYDGLNRLKTATVPAGVATFTYWEDGLLKTKTHGGVLVENRLYDEDGRLTSVESLSPLRPAPGLVSLFQYGYDENGNRLVQRETRDTVPEETTTYGYDDANRLVGVQYPTEAVLYQLDRVGNRLGEKKAAVAALTVVAFAALTNPTSYISQRYNAPDWLLEKAAIIPAGPSKFFQYDANGNRVSEGARRYDWSVRNTLTAAFDGTTELGRYDYDANLQRVKADTANGHVEYVLDGKHVLRETGTRTRRYHYEEGEALAVTDGQGPRWLSVDALGSVSAEVNAATAAVTKRQYDAWGNYRSGTAPSGGQARLGYTGHQYDDETGLTYARARYYDSVNGVFLSRDTYEGAINSAPSLHRYSYAAGNPLRYTDPSGHFLPLLIGLAALGAELGFFGSVIGQEVTEGKTLSTVDYGQAGTMALVGGVAGGASALAGAGALATTAAWGIGGLEGSAAIAATVSGATGAFVSGSGGVLANGGTVGEAIEMGFIQAPLGALGGAVGAGVSSIATEGAALVGFSKGASAVVGDAVGGVVGDLAYQSGAVGAGLQQDVSLSQAAMGTAVGLGVGAGVRKWQESVAMEHAASPGASCPIGGCGGPGSCFVAGTIVAKPDGGVPIEQLRLGQRVEAGNTQCSEQHIGADDRSIVLEMPNPLQPTDTVHVEILRSVSWLIASGAGGRGGAWIELPEVGVAGWARVVSVEDAPKEESGPGCLVLMTVRHVASQVLSLRVAGETQPIELTPVHPLYLEGVGWRPAGELVKGNLLRTQAGPAELLSVDEAQPNRDVYNIEVSLEHAYRVGRSGVWAHNTCDEPPPVVPPQYQTPYKPLSPNERVSLKDKVDARTATRDEYAALQWDRRFANRRARGVDRFWAKERRTLKADEPGTRNWDPVQRESILNRQTPAFNGEPIEGHHTFNALDHPQLADQPNNIYPATSNEHLYRWHGGNYQNDTFGSPLNPSYPEEF